MIKRLASGIVAMAFLASPAFSAPPTNCGFFVGGAFGTSEFDDDGAFSWLRFDDSDTSFGVFAGYKFFRYFAVEARYGDLGTYSISDGFATETFDVSVVSAHAVGIIPFGQTGWELYGQLGVGQVDLKCAGCSDETAASAGLGVRFSPTRQLAIGVQVDAYAWEDDYYDFSVATMQAIIQYSF
jgi:hypothetical protein